MDKIVDFAYTDTLVACHNEFRYHFEPMVKETILLAEVDVFTAITLRLVRLAKATAVLCRAGLVEESKLPLRSASELIVNLLYIMDVGPATGSKSQRELAEQFAVYGNLAYYEMLRQRHDKARAAYKKRKGMSDAEFDIFLLEKENLADEAARLHGCVNCTDDLNFPVCFSGRQQVISGLS